MATTPNYGFVLPTVGGDDAAWGGFLNTNWSDLDTDLDTIQTDINSRILTSGIGSAVQAHDDQLDTLAGVSAANAAAVGNLTGVNSGDEVAATVSIAGILEIATTAEMRNKSSNKITTPATLKNAAEVVTLSDGANIALNMDIGFNFVVTLAGNRTLDNPTNNDPGQSGFIKVIQDGTGSRTLAYGSEYKFTGGVDPILSTAANAIDYLFYTVVTATQILITLLSDVK